MSVIQHNIEFGPLPLKLKVLPEVKLTFWHTTDYTSVIKNSHLTQKFLSAWSEFVMNGKTWGILFSYLLVGKWKKHIFNVLFILIHMEGNSVGNYLNFFYRVLWKNVDISEDGHLFNPSSTIQVTEAFRFVSQVICGRVEIWNLWQRLLLLIWVNYEPKPNNSYLKLWLKIFLTQLDFSDKASLIISSHYFFWHQGFQKRLNRQNLYC